MHIVCLDDPNRPLVGIPTVESEKGYPRIPITVSRDEASEPPFLLALMIYIERVLRVVRREIPNRLLVAEDVQDRTDSMDPLRMRMHRRGCENDERG